MEGKICNASCGHRLAIPTWILPGLVVFFILAAASVVFAQRNSEEYWAASVASQFNLLPQAGYRQYEGRALAFTYWQGGTDFIGRDPETPTHLQGIARYDDDGVPYFFFSHNGNPAAAGADYPAELLVVKVNNHYGPPGEALGRTCWDDTIGEACKPRNNRTVATSGTSEEPSSFIFKNDNMPGGPGWKHAGGMQVISDTLVVALEKTCNTLSGEYPQCQGSGDESIGALAFFDLRNLDQCPSTNCMPLEHVMTQYASGELLPTMGAIGVTKYGGKYVFVHSSGDMDDWTFMEANSLTGAPTKKNMVHISDDWSQTANFVQSRLDWKLYLVMTSSNTPAGDGVDQAILYEVGKSGGNYNLTKIQQLHMYLEEDNSIDLGDFAAVGGVYASPSGQLILYSGPYDNKGYDYSKNDGCVNPSGTELCKAVTFGEYTSSFGEAPTLAVYNQTAREGEPQDFTLGQFTDDYEYSWSNPPSWTGCESYLAVVDWGDSSPDTNVNLTRSLPSYPYPILSVAIVASHTYTQTPSSPGSVEVWDCDGFISQKQTFTVTYVPANQPLVTGFSKSADEDYPIAIPKSDFTSHFSDADGDSLTKIKIVSLPGDGVLYVVASGGGSQEAYADLEIDAGAGFDHLEFAPATDWNGATSFQWNGFDGRVYAASAATVNLTVNAVNDAPELDNTGLMKLDSIDHDPVTNPGTLVSGIIASAGGDRISDGDGAGEGIAVIAVNNTLDGANGDWQFSTNGGTSWSSFGAVSPSAARLLAADGSTKVRFNPPAGKGGTVDPGITFRAWDRTSGSNGGTAAITQVGGATAFSVQTETASITVRPDESPVAVDDYYTANEDTPLTVDAPGVLANDYDPISPPTSLVVASCGSPGSPSYSQPAHGSVTFNMASGGFTYTPAANYSGVDSFWYSALKPRMIGDPPTIYWPLCDFATVHITVTLLHDDPPVVSDVIKSGGEDNSIFISKPEFSGHFSDPDGDGMTKLKVVSLPANGTLNALISWFYHEHQIFGRVDCEAGDEFNIATWYDFQFVPDANWNGTTSFQWNSSDGSAYADSDAMVTLTVNAANDAPVVSGLNRIGNEDTSLPIPIGDFTSHFSDVEGNSMTSLKVVSLPANGTLQYWKLYHDWYLAPCVAGQEISGQSMSRGLEFAPDANWNGATSFQWNGNDGSLYAASDATAALGITPVNDAPLLDNSGVPYLDPVLGSNGTLVADLVDRLGGSGISDVDANALEGIALIGAANEHGSWQYSLNDGATWLEVGDAAANNRLLAADDMTRLRFTPNPGFFGTVLDAITFRAWDHTSGSNGGTTITTPNGGTTAFSTNTETASIRMASSIFYLPLVAR